MARVLARVETLLDGREFLAGAFSLADVAFAPRLLILPQLGIEIEARLKNVITWAARLRERPSVQTLGL